MSFFEMVAWFRHPNALPNYARNYLRILKADYLGLKKPQGYVEPPDVTAFIRNDDEWTWRWSDIVALENAIIDILPDDGFPSVVALFRERYRNIVGVERYAIYEASAPPDPKTASPGLLRADVRALAERIHYQLVNDPAREKMRNRISLLLAAVMSVAAMSLLQSAIDWHFPFPSLSVKCFDVSSCVPMTPLEFVAVAGLFGGFVSVQSRLQAATEVDPFFKRLELSSGWGSIILISPLVGIVFAIVLYMILVAGIVSGGPLFPTFLEGGGAAHLVGASKATVPSFIDSFNAFVVGSSPKAPADWAKLAVWCFVAGFAERFVPDVLTRLANVETFFTKK
jgi:hypothetical protein